MLICDRTKCTGCGACADVCPKGCVSVQYDSCGFLQSYVDESKCVQCKQCISVCPANKPKNDRSVLRACKVRRKNMEAILGSTSGGVAALLAENFVKNGGTVCGCGFDENLVLRHTLENMPEALEKFKGSKYVQSNTAGVYKAIRERLTSGEKVLFFGTPCQVSGLRSFLNKSYENLLTVDLVCHGVASSKILEQYINREQQSHDKIIDVKFRAKKHGYIECQNNDLLLIHKDKESVIDHQKGIVLWFASGVSLRESCYSCNFVSTCRCGDVTLADYIGDDMSEDDRRYGASMVFVNTPEGERLLDEIQTEAFTEEKDLQESLRKYARIQQKRRPPAVRKRFFADLRRLSLEEMERKYTLKKILPNKMVLYTRAAVRRLKRIFKVNQ